MRKVITIILTAATMYAAASANAALYWTPWVSEEKGGPWSYCMGFNEGAVGFGCRGSYCDDIRMLCETFQGGMQINPSSYYLTNWFSEEGALPPGIGSNQPTPNQGVCRYWIPGTIDSFSPGVVTGVHCKGSYCDNLQLECGQPVKYFGSTPRRATATSCRNVGPYSEENGSLDFGPNQYIVSITCTGRYCDNKKFRVCTFVAP